MKSVAGFSNWDLFTRVC